MEFLGAFITSFIAVGLITPFIIKTAKSLKMISYPSKDRWHSEPTALLGGVGIFLGLIIGGIYSGIYTLIDYKIIFCIFIIFLTGLYDDIFNLTPQSKFLLNILVAVFVVSSGILFGKGVALPIYFSLPITFLWIVGITNAMNLLDNMDGLCAGISGIISFYLGIIFFLNSQIILSIFSSLFFMFSWGVHMSL